jgi:hypothetical protein
MSKTKKVLIAVITAVVFIAGAVAVILINKPVESAPTATSHISLAENYLLDLNYEAAIAEYRAAIQIDPKNADYYIALAEVYVKMGDTEAAIEVLEKGLGNVDEPGKDRIQTYINELTLKPVETITTATTTVTTTTTAPLTTVNETTEPETTTVTTTIPALVTNDITDKFPDLNFRAAVRETLGIGENDPITIEDIQKITILDVSGRDIDDLSGLEYFTSLQELNCRALLLRTLPELPDSLVVLICANNTLESLPKLPNSLQVLECELNILDNLPELPDTLNRLTCNNNHLTQLPELPDSLTYLYCSQNDLTSLPELPNSLISLYCFDNDNIDINKIVFKDGSNARERFEREGSGYFFEY